MVCVHLTVDETGIFSISPCNGDMNLVMHGSLAHSLSYLSLSLFSNQTSNPQLFFSLPVHISFFFFFFYWKKKDTRTHEKLHKSCLVEPHPQLYHFKIMKNKVEKSIFDEHIVRMWYNNWVTYNPLQLYLFATCSCTPLSVFSLSLSLSIFKFVSF